MGLSLGPVLFFVILYFQPFGGLGYAGHATLGITVWLAIWWMIEMIPMPVTSLLPIILLPAAGAAPIEQTTAAYGDKMLFLFIGGFIIAKAVEKWNLHKRIALNIIVAIGASPARILLGFMIATAALSMWISNTATTMMMITIGSALVLQLSPDDKQEESFAKSLLLGVAYAASIGGIATLIGTPTNPIFVAIAADLYSKQVSFIDWMLIGVPFSIVVTLFVWWYLSRRFGLHRLDIGLKSDYIRQSLRELGRFSYEEKAVAIVFGLTALAWIFNTFLLQRFIPGLHDTSIAIMGAVSLFLIPSKATKNLGLLSWHEAVQIPWGVILLFGGGLSLAAAFKSSGLAVWCGEQLVGLGNLPTFCTILAVVLFINFLTEVTSNVATASIALPILAATAEQIGLHPFLLMVPATMAASCAFMLPVATAPNAIVFGYGKLKVKEMASAGFWINLVTSVIIAVLGYFFVNILI